MTERLERVDLSGVKGMFAESETGKRDRDEDYIACGNSIDLRVAVLCDGMGVAGAGMLPRRPRLGNSSQAFRGEGRNWKMDGSIRRTDSKQWRGRLAIAMVW